MLYPMAAKNFGPGHNRVVQSRPGHDPWPATKFTPFESPSRKEYNVGHSSKTVKYEPSYGHLNFYYSSVPLYFNFKQLKLYYKQLKILKNQFLSKSFVKKSKILSKFVKIKNQKIKNQKIKSNHSKVVFKMCWPNG